MHVVRFSHITVQAGPVKNRRIFYIFLYGFNGILFYGFTTQKGQIGGKVKIMHDGGRN